jgi:type I restriction enzyme S subunit
MSFPRYPKYKDSGVEWLGKVPAHWEVKRLKRACHVFPSNVDKKSHEGEPPVRLCNYTDVYYNDTITAEMEFMTATASSDQIAKFTLRAGDTIITKDSETADDIAIGAYVPEDLPGVVCGYHLSMVRPMPGTDGAYVKRLFDSIYAKSCFAVLATGLTRVGLGQYELDNVELPFPPLAEQTKIAEFLDRETGKIDELVAEQRRLMELLKEKRQAVISHAVTRGLNPAAPLKPSGTFWFDQIPQHWASGPLKHFWEVIDCKHVTVPFLDEGIPVASIMEVRSFDLDLSQAEKTSEEAFNMMIEGGRQPRLGDVIYCRNTANTGTSAYVGIDEQIALGQDVCLIKSSGKSGRYLNYVLHSGFMASELETLMVGSTFKRINVAQIRGLIIPCPPLDEQKAIASYLDEVSTKFDTLTAEAQRAIELLQERRTALISAAVTGQIDVRHWRESARVAAAAFT